MSVTEVPMPGIDLKAIRASSYIGKAIPQREWIWNSWASAGVVTGLGGPPGVAKSLLAQQLCTHAATGTPFLGDDFMKVPALHITCEDDEDELHRRQVNICTAMQVPFHNDLHLMSWVGDESLLVFLDNGILSRTALFNAVDDYIGEHGIKFVTMDLIPDFWNGNEINRTHVNSFVKSHLAHLAQRHQAAIMPLYHPSVRGMSDGTGTSGSTAWDGSFRGRIYIERSKDDDDPKNPDRKVKRVKANYAELDEKEVTWRDGYLWEKSSFGGVDEKVEKDVRIFLEILQYCEGNNIEVSPSANTKKYYGRLFPEIWKMMDGRHATITQKQMEKAHLKAAIDGVVEETKRTGKLRPRLKFIGYFGEKNR